MTIEILTQLQAIEDSIPEGGLVKANQLREIHKLLNAPNFMYLQPTSIKEIGDDVRKCILKENSLNAYTKINKSILILSNLGYI